MLKLFSHDASWACLLLTPIAGAIFLTMLCWGRRESRLLAGCWGLLIGAIVVSPGWYLLALTWRDKASGGIAGLIVAVLELIDVAVAVAVGTGVALLLNVLLTKWSDGVRIRWAWLGLPAVLFGALLVTAVVVRWPVIQNERAWSQANESLAPVGLLASECKDGEVTAIQVEFELSLKLIFKRLPVQPEFADRVAAHRQVEYLFIDQLNITDADLQQIAQLSNLKHLEVGSDLVTDNGIVALKGASQLTHLSLKCPASTDAALPTIVQLQELEYLDIAGVQITDQGLMKLRDLPKLKSITVDSSYLTQEGLEEFKSGRYEPFVSVPENRDPVTGATIGPKVLPTRAELTQKQKP